MKKTVNEEQVLQEWVGRGVRIPPQPRVLIELRERLAKGECDARALAKVLGQDPGIAAMVFKAARSPLFTRGAKRFDRLDQVLQVIGLRQTLNLVQSFALATAISDKNRPAFEAFWARSMEIAHLAAIVADDRVSICNVFPEQAFLAGMFRECGVPVLMQRFPDYCQSIGFGKTSCWPSIADEDLRFNTDHCSIGYLVARHWNLPDFVSISILYHRDLPGEESGATRSLVAILHLANQIYYQISGVADEGWDDIKPAVLEELAIPVSTFQEYSDEVIDRFHDQK